MEEVIVYIDKLQYEFLKERFGEEEGKIHLKWISLETGEEKKIICILDENLKEGETNSPNGYVIKIPVVDIKSLCSDKL